MYTEAIAAEVRAAIERAPGTPAFRALLAHLMARPGRVLAPAGRAEWPALVCELCRALGGDARAAQRAAAAVEFAVAAIDVADDLVDDEWDGTPDHQRRAVNASLALSCLAQDCALRLVDPLGRAGATVVAQLVARASLASCAGQDLDLRLETSAEVSEQQAYDMTRQKSGSLVAMACQVGAAVATDDAAILEVMGRFGEHVGVIAQLVNDLAGVVGGPLERGSDLRLRKKTLPVAYALRCAQEEGGPAILSWYHGTSRASGLDAERVVAAICDAGALHYAWVVADAHRSEARRIIRDLARATGREQVCQLCRLIPVIRERRAP